jgi:hypothetical protein
VDNRIRFTGFLDGSHRDPFDFSTISSLTASISELNSCTSEQLDRHNEALRSIVVVADSESGSELVEIEEVLKYSRQLVDPLRHDSSSNPLPVSSLPFSALGTVLIHAFLSTDNIEYLDESIAVLRDGLKMHCIPYHYPR